MIAVLEDDVQYLSISDIMEGYGLRKSYVYKLACIHQWRRVYDDNRGVGKPYARYHMGDVAEVLGSYV